VDTPKELNQKTIGAFSYYYDRATEYGLIGKWECFGKFWASFEDIYLECFLQFFKFDMNYGFF
jgi:hypothetical protein